MVNITGEVTFPFLEKIELSNRPIGGPPVKTFTTEVTVALKHQHCENLSVNIYDPKFYLLAFFFNLSIAIKLDVPIKTVIVSHLKSYSDNCRFKSSLSPPSSPPRRSPSPLYSRSESPPSPLVRLVASFSSTSSPSSSPSSPGRPPRQPPPWSDRCPRRPPPSPPPPPTWISWPLSRYFFNSTI